MNCFHEGLPSHHHNEHHPAQNHCLLQTLCPKVVSLASTLICSLKKCNQLPPCAYLNSLSATTDADKAEFFHA